VDNARLFALLNISTADALIACWDAKYTYNFWRPVTAIHFAGDSALNPATVSDPTWTPLIVTPNFPSYTSAHSTVSGAASTILTSLFGSDYSFTTGSDGLLGVTRSFESFAAAAAEAGQSRIYGGIHYQFDNQGGLASGAALGRFVFQNFLAPDREEDNSPGNRQGGRAQGDVQTARSAIAPDALVFLVMSPTNGSIPGRVVLGGEQPRMVEPAPSEAAVQESALATGQTITPWTLPTGHYSPQVLDTVFADMDDGTHLDVLG
jgi:membrane-associated phospholipid phosphatase